MFDIWPEPVSVRTIRQQWSETRVSLPNLEAIEEAIQRKALQADDLDDLPPLLRLAERLEPALRRTFLARVRSMKASTSLERLADAVATGRSDLVETALTLATVTAGMKLETSQIVQRAFLAAVQMESDVSLAPVGIQPRLDLVNRHAVEWAQTRSTDLVTEVERDTRDAIRTAVVESVSGTGKTVRDVARELRDVVGLHSRQQRAVSAFREKMTNQLTDKHPRWSADRLAEEVNRKTSRYGDALLRYRSEVIARTEVVRAESEGQLTLWKEAKAQGLLDPDRTVRVWITTPDDRLDEACEEMDGEEVALDEPWIVGDGRSIMVPQEIHPQCLPGHTVVRVCGQLQGAMQRRYQGILIIIHTASGYELACTPNHPILTPHGWIVAGSLQKGHYVISARSRELTLPRDADDQDMPATIKQITSAYRVSLAVSGLAVETSRPDFHGDGINDEVAIVWANRFQMGSLVSMSLQQSTDRSLQQCWRACSLDRPRVGHFVREALWHTAHGIVSGRHLIGSRCWCHIRPTTAISSTHRVVSLMSIGRQCLTLRNSHARKALLCGTLSSLARMPSRTESYPSSSQHRPHFQFAYPEPRREDIQRFAGHVSLDQIIQVERRWSSGHVYNLQTGSGWYLANGIILHNCRCSAGLRFTKGA